MFIDKDLYYYMFIDKDLFDRVQHTDNRRSMWISDSQSVVRFSLVVCGKLVRGTRRNILISNKKER